MNRAPVGGRVAWLRKCTGGVLALGLLVVASWAGAWELAGSKTVYAVTKDQQRIAIGTIDFAPESGGTTAYLLKIDHKPFRDYFLSMKEFKCLEDPSEIACHVPYPYRHPARVAADDYAWLEHDLLFLYKQPSEFGAKLWNGVYFELERSEQGLTGRPQAIDLNLISAPPDRLDVPPYEPALRDDIPRGLRWIDGLLIQ